MIEIIEQKHFYSSPSYTSKHLYVAQYEKFDISKNYKDSLSHLPAVRWFGTL